MKKIIILLNEHLSHFWFVLLMIIIACFVVFFLDPWSSITLFGKNWDFGVMADTIGRFWTLFLLPLFIISIIVSVGVWLKNKTGDNYRGLGGLIITVISFASVLLFITKLTTFNISVKNGTSIFSAPSTGVPENLKNIRY